MRVAFLHETLPSAAHATGEAACDAEKEGSPPCNGVMQTVTLTSRGQITSPRPWRDALAPAPGARLQASADPDPAADHAGRLPLSKYTLIGPLFLISMIPRSSKWKLAWSKAWVAWVTLILPGRPWDSILAAVFTVSPHRS